MLTELKAFTGNAYVKYCIEILALSKNYGIKGKLYMKFIEKGFLKSLIMLDWILTRKNQTRVVL